jgi:uncharacterized protein YcbX
MPTVAHLNVTPVKSTRLNHPEHLRIERYGPAGDREFFFVDHSGKRFSATAKAPMLLVGAAYDDENDELELRFPDGRTIRGPAAGDGEALTVDFYGRPVPSHIVDGRWTDELTAYAGTSTRLARTDRPGAGLDVEPVTIVSLASVAELARQGERTSLDPRRFRMTIELDGCEPHEEDTWEGRRIRVGEVELAVGEQVPRCVVTTLDPETGARDFPTLSVISGYRGVPPRTSPPFGVYARVISPGVVRVGDDVTLADGEPAQA